MVDWNPNFPEVLGLEWWPTVYAGTRVWSGARARMQRLSSTSAETISALRMSTTVNPSLKEDCRTVVDIIPVGSEKTPLFEPIDLVPNSDVETNGWRTHTGATTNLFQSIDDSTRQWGPTVPAAATDIENPNRNEEYRCTVDASRFDTGGDLENARIGFVEVRAILGCHPTGRRKMRTNLAIGSTDYRPAGGWLKSVHAFGEMHAFWYGELNPATGLPWTPADIVAFDVGGGNTLRLESGNATPDQPVVCVALALVVWVVPTENRAAVGVWRRPETLTDRLVNAETDALVSMPDGTPGWSKADATEYLFLFRQSVSPALYGAVNADDVRWNGAYQDLGPGGQPRGIVYPFTGSDSPPSTGLASRDTRYDSFGRVNTLDEAPLTMRSRVICALALIDDLDAVSADSQPYRMDVVDIVHLRSSETVGQNLSIPSQQTYLGVRLPAIPPSAGDSTLTVTVHESGTGAQVGGSFSITASEARALRAGPSGIRYISGFLSSGATIPASTIHEIRLSLSTSVHEWLVFAPDASLGPEVSFNGSSTGHGLVLGGSGGTVIQDRDLEVNLIRQPDPPTNVAATIVDVPAQVPISSEVTTIEHVEVSWTEPAIGMGAFFDRYELDRQLDGGSWERLADIFEPTVTSFVDHEVPRDVPATYRIRAVGTDGRFSEYGTTGSVTPTAPGLMVVFTSNFKPEIEVAFIYNRESTYPILSAEGDERVSIHGADYQIVFQEQEDRGIGWRTQITVNQLELQDRGGPAVLGPLLNAIRTMDVPYVCVLDNQGTRILGHVFVSEVPHAQPHHRYTAEIEAIPTHSETIPVEVHS